MTSSEAQIRRFYLGHHDRITDKRFNSPYWLRRYGHRGIYERSLRHISEGEYVLDAGCGDGVLSLLMAARKSRVVGVDMSLPNISAARERARLSGLDAQFLVGDAEFLPFRSDSFDVVVSSHVLEHLPEPGRGVRELARTTRERVVIAMPTCLNPAAWALLGGDVYWKVTRRSPLACALGVLRVLWALINRSEGPQEGYAGHGSLPHVFRFPWAMTRLVNDNGLRIRSVEAGPLLAPYLATYLQPLRWVQRELDARLSARWPFRWFGFGTHLVAAKVPDGHADS